MHVIVFFTTGMKGQIERKLTKPRSTISDPMTPQPRPGYPLVRVSRGADETPAWRFANGAPRPTGEVQAFTFDNTETVLPIRRMLRGVNLLNETIIILNEKSYFQTNKQVS